MEKLVKIKFFCWSHLKTKLTVAFSLPFNCCVGCAEICSILIVDNHIDYGNVEIDPQHVGGKGCSK